MVVVIVVGQSCHVLLLMLYCSAFIGDGSVLRVLCLIGYGSLVALHCLFVVLQSWNIIDVSIQRSLFIVDVSLFIV